MAESFARSVHLNRTVGTAGAAATLRASANQFSKRVLNPVSIFTLISLLRFRPCGRGSVLLPLLGKATVPAVIAVSTLLAAGYSRPARAQTLPAQSRPADSSPDASSDAPPDNPAVKPELKPVPPTPIAVKKAELGGGDPWNPAWTRMIERSMPRNLLSRRRAPAVESLCPRYGAMTLANRRAFWAYFFQALAGAEAGLKPTADVRHDDPQVAVMDSVTHRIVRQEGLLQLAYEDSERYGCHFDWRRDKDLPEHDPAKTILQPRDNLLCGIRIVGNQLVKQHKPLLSESSYWVTLRPEHPSFKVFLRQMANVPEACGSPLRKPALEKASLPAADEAEKTQPPAARQPRANAETQGDPPADPPSRSH